MVRGEASRLMFQLGVGVGDGGRDVSGRLNCTLPSGLVAGGGLTVLRVSLGLEDHSDEGDTSGPATCRISGCRLTTSLAGHAERTGVNKVLDRNLCVAVEKNAFGAAGGLDRRPSGPNTNVPERITGDVELLAIGGGVPRAVPKSSSSKSISESFHSSSTGDSMSDNPICTARRDESLAAAPSTADLHAQLLLDIIEQLK